MWGTKKAQSEAKEAYGNQRELTGQMIELWWCRYQKLDQTRMDPGTKH